MVSSVPAPDGLLTLAEDLARLAEHIRIEVDKNDAPMAGAYALSLKGAARFVSTGVQAWSEAQPPPPRQTNPHGPVTLSDPTIVVAIDGLSDADLFEYYQQLEWSYVHETRLAPRRWLDRARRQARAAVRARPRLPDV